MSVIFPDQPRFMNALPSSLEFRVMQSVVTVAEPGRVLVKGKDVTLELTNKRDVLLFVDHVLDQARAASILKPVRNQEEARDALMNFRTTMRNAGIEI